MKAPLRACLALASAVLAMGCTSHADSRPKPSIGPHITRQPQDQAVPEGDRATFIVAATGDQPIAYQWLRNGLPVAGADSDVFSVVARPVDHGDTFSVRVSNPAGAVESSTATLLVSEGPPNITGQPQGVAALTGEVVTFSVVATGTALTYQWRRNEIDIVGATRDLYVTDAVSLADNGAVYSVVVTGAGGSTTSAGATLTVIASNRL